MNKNVPLYYNENKTAFGVLVSYGFGAGFSTWGEREYAYDRRIIEFWMEHRGNKEWMNAINTFSYDNPNSALAEAREFMKSIGYNEHTYFGGFADCDLEWVPAGARFRINEYDGAESLEIEDGSNWW